MELWKYLATNRKSCTEFAMKLGISRDHLSRIIHYKSVPSPELAMHIQALTNGEVIWWQLLERCVIQKLKKKE